MRRLNCVFVILVKQKVSEYDQEKHNHKTPTNQQHSEEESQKIYSSKQPK